MNDKNPSELDNYGSLQYWKSRPPEELLEAFINELRAPLTSIKGWVEILRLEGMKEVHPRALDSIYAIAMKIEKSNDEIREYLVEFTKAKSDSSKL